MFREDQRVRSVAPSREESFRAELCGHAAVGRDPVPVTTRDTATEALHAAVVHAAGRICFLTAAPSRAVLAERLATYVCEQAPIQLRSVDAARVMELAASGEHEKAVAHYFGSVGEKWDEERLVVVQVPHGGGPG